MNTKTLTDIDEIDEYLYEMKTLVEEHPVDQSRWETSYEKVVFDLKTDTFWRLNWQVGSTEYQETDLEIQATEVEPYETTVTAYRPVKA